MNEDSGVEGWREAIRAAFLKDQAERLKEEAEAHKRWIAREKSALGWKYWPIIFKRKLTFCAEGARKHWQFLVTTLISIVALAVSIIALLK